MKMIQRMAATAFGFCIMSAALDAAFHNQIVIQKATAIVGRPLTPASGAGVARRTSRRVIRRSTIYIASLPAACTRIVVEGVSLYQCGGTYYQPYGSQYVVVYVD